MHPVLLEEGAGLIYVSFASLLEYTRNLYSKSSPFPPLLPCKSWSTRPYIPHTNIHIHIHINLPCILYITTSNNNLPLHNQPLEFQIWLSLSDVWIWYSISLILLHATEYHANIHPITVASRCFPPSMVMLPRVIEKRIPSTRKWNSFLFCLVSCRNHNSLEVKICNAGCGYVCWQYSMSNEGFANAACRLSYKLI